MGKNDQPALPCAHAHSLIPTAKQNKNILRQYSFFPNQFSLLFETHRKVFRSQFDRIDSFILDVTFLRNRRLQTNHNIVGSGYLIRPSVLECVSVCVSVSAKCVSASECRLIDFFLSNTSDDSGCIHHAAYSMAISPIQ